MNSAAAAILDKNEYKEKFYLLLRVVHSINSGMTRRQVERLLPTPQGGFHLSNVTVYTELPGFQIVVPFNEVGFSGAASNQVNGRPVLKVRHVINLGTENAIVQWVEIE